MEIDKLFGLPAHPLFVHFAIVLVPLAAIAVIAAVMRPPWQKALRPIAVGFVVCATIAILMAAGSGEQFDQRTDTTQPKVLDLHKDLANVTRVFVLITLVLVVAWAYVSRRQETQISEATDQGDVARSKQLVMFSSALVVIFVILTTVWTIRTGHSGAKAVWYDTGQLTPKKGG